MRRSLSGYTAYSISCGVVWAALLIAGTLAGNGKAGHAVLYVFLGWVLGWLSATIARWVYPPPKKWRQSGAVAP